MGDWFVRCPRKTESSYKAGSMVAHVTLKYLNISHLRYYHLPNNLRYFVSIPNTFLLSLRLITSSSFFRINLQFILIIAKNFHTNLLGSNY